MMVCRMAVAGVIGYAEYHLSPPWMRPSAVLWLPEIIMRLGASLCSATSLTTLSA
jgi:hypothetical protein